MQDFPGPIQRASEGVNSKARGARMSPWLCYRGREHNQLENTLAAPPQFEVNYLNANLIALSFIFTYLPTCSSRGMISTGCHALHRNIINSCRTKADRKQEVLSQVIFCRNSEHGAVMDEDEHIRIRTVSATKPAKTDSRGLSIITMGLVTMVLLASAYVLEAKPVLALLNGAPILVLGDPE